MSYFEFRKWIESSVPWWLPLVPIIAYVFATTFWNWLRTYDEDWSGTDDTI